VSAATMWVSIASRAVQGRTRCWPIWAAVWGQTAAFLKQASSRERRRAPEEPLGNPQQSRDG
jgi:hypothetical protein